MEVFPSITYVLAEGLRGVSSYEMDDLWGFKKMGHNLLLVEVVNSISHANHGEHEVKFCR
jgi:hypothetical protein